MRKKILLCALVIISTLNTYAQIGKKQLPALKNSIVKYYQTDKNTGDPVNEFMMTFELFFNKSNQQLGDAIKEEELRTKLSYRKIAGVFYDSLYYYVINVLLPEEVNAAEQNVRKYAALTTQYYCDCFKQHGTDGIKEQEFSELVQKCTNTMANDNTFMQKVAQSVSLNMLADKNILMKISGITLLADCKSITDYFYRSIKDIYAESYIIEGENAVFDILDRLNASSLEEKKRLSGIFPTHKKFASDITKINKLINTEKVERETNSKNNEDGTVTIVKTFYQKNKKQILLLGQAEYVLNKRSPSAIVLSAKYVTSEKIKDAKSIIKTIQDNDFILPPPPMGELREIKIDTKKEGN
ncbi:hypothetical protein ACFS6H_00330 [Terrimonas rubra]|uniref:Uncharacterized protein n=1 Tax=Terrimonas rubra TaxID=1035890 RepID=A0ABW5ZYN1_9BACT